MICRIEFSHLKIKSISSARWPQLGGTWSHSGDFSSECENMLLEYMRVLTVSLDQIKISVSIVIT